LLIGGSGGRELQLADRSSHRLAARDPVLLIFFGRREIQLGGAMESFSVPIRSFFEDENEGRGRGRFPKATRHLVSLRHF
jgi:hypothetical protein